VSAELDNPAVAAIAISTWDKLADWAMLEDLGFEIEECAL